MVLGVIKTRHIICHPVMFIGAFGFIKYLHFLAKCMDFKQHHFINLLF